MKMSVMGRVWLLIHEASSVLGFGLDVAETKDTRFSLTRER